MKNTAPILLLVLFFSTLQSQYSFQKMLFIPYGDRQEQVKIRKENDGVYGPAAFLWFNDRLYLLDSENGKLKTFTKDGLFAESVNVSNNITTLFTGQEGSAILFDNKTITPKKNIFPGDENSGKIAKTGICRKSDNVFVFSSGNRTQEIKSDSKIASARLLGFDRNGNLYFDVEIFIREIPCEVKREVIVYNSVGKLFAKIVIPNLYYAYLPQDLQIDDDGNIYHQIANKTGIEIIKWTYSRRDDNNVVSEIRYPAEYENSFHYNSLLKEPVENLQKSDPSMTNKTMVTRDESLIIADTYYRFEWTCQPVNKSNGLVLAADGKYIRTPDWIVVGNNKQMPYQWGGFSTPTGFTSGVSGGKYAGDNNCTGNGSSAAVGVDCSGFVSRCWRLSSHYATSMMPAIITPYSTWQELKPGDAIHKVGHVRLCVGHNSDGTVRVIEASGVDWKVSYRNYSYTNLTGYTPNKYKNMTESVTKIGVETSPSPLFVKSYPNPFNGKVNFIISSPHRTDAEFEIFDSYGRIVERKEIEINQGENILSWDSKDLYGRTVSSGVYFYRIKEQNSKNIFLNKILLIR